MGNWMRRFICGLRGHDALLHFEEGRISLLCVTCGDNSPGWTVGRVPARSEEDDPAPRRVVRLPLVGARRTA